MSDLQALRTSIISQIANPADRPGIESLLSMLTSTPQDVTELLMRGMILLNETGKLTTHVPSAEELLASFDGVDTGIGLFDPTDPSASVKTTQNCSLFPELDEVHEVATPAQMCAAMPFTDHVFKVGSFHEAPSTIAPDMLILNDPCLPTLSSQVDNPDLLFEEFTNVEEHYGTRPSTTTCSTTATPPLFSVNLKLPNTTLPQTCDPASVLLPPVELSSPPELVFSPTPPSEWNTDISSILEEMAMRHSSNLGQVALQLNESPDLLRRATQLLDWLNAKLDEASGSPPPSRNITLPPPSPPMSYPASGQWDMLMSNEKVEELLEGINRKTIRALEAIERVMTGKHKAVTGQTGVLQLSKQDVVVPKAPTKRKAAGAGLRQSPAPKKALKQDVGGQQALVACSSCHDTPAKPKPKAKRAAKKEPMIIEIDGKLVQLD